MSGIMEYLISFGLTVTGSDRVDNDQTKRLRKLGAKVYLGHAEKNLSGASGVVVSSAVEEDNIELTTAKRLGIPIYKRSVFLNLVLSRYKNSVGVCGSHGKTTTTAMIAHVLSCANKYPSAFIGGEAQGTGNVICGGGEVAVFEACEYKKNFLDFNPKVAVVLNIDNDHLDCYGNMENMTKAFQSFIKNKVSIVNADDALAKSIVTPTSITFAIDNSATFTARQLRKNQNGYSFTLYKNSRQCGRVKLGVLGRHNVYNALATIAVVDYFGVSLKMTKEALESFSGVKRRMEYLGKYNKLLVYADYAHHPNEIKATLDAINNPKINDVVVFQPHTFSRTRLLLDDFVVALSRTKKLVIYKTYPAREKYDKSGSAYTLFNVIKKQYKGKIYYTKDKNTLKKILSQEQTLADRALFLGAGDVYDVARSLVAECSKKSDVL